MLTKEIVVQLQYEATHCWANCDIPEVMFLKNAHRHMFHIAINKVVMHNDRDIEIIQLKRAVLKYLDVKYNHDFGGLSCEDIAEDLLYSFECTTVQVLEDGENGAILRK